MDRCSDLDKSHRLLAVRIAPAPKFLVNPTLAQTITLTKTMVSPCALRNKTNAETSKRSSLKRAIPKQWRSLDLRLARPALTRSNPIVAHQLSSFKMELPTGLNSLSLNLRILKPKRTERAKARTRVQKMVCQLETRLSKTLMLMWRNLPMVTSPNLAIKVKGMEQTACQPRADMTLPLVATKPSELTAKAATTRAIDTVGKSAPEERCMLPSPRTTLPMPFPPPLEECWLKTPQPLSLEPSPSLTMIKLCN